MNPKDQFTSYLNRKKQAQQQQQDDSESSLELVVVDTRDSQKKLKQTSLETFMNRKTAREQNSNKQLIINRPSIQHDSQILYNKSSTLNKKSDPLSSITFRTEKMSAPIFQPYSKEAEILSSQKYQIQTPLIKRDKTIQKQPISKLSQYQNQILKNPSEYPKTPIYKYEEDTNKLNKSFEVNFVNKDYQNYAYSYQLPEFTKQYNERMKCGPSIIEKIKEKGKEERRLKREKEKEEKRVLAEKRKKQQEQKRMQGFSAFMDYVLVDKGKDERSKKKQEDEQKLNNLEIHNQMLYESEKQNDNRETGGKKINNGLIYKKQMAIQEKIPFALLKILLSFKFSTTFLTPQTKKVPNKFSDQMLYRKIFHYLVTNECLADIHLRMKKIQDESNVEAIPIQINHFSKNSDGLVQLTLSQIANPLKIDLKKEQFLLKNLWLSKNRLGVVTNMKKFELEYFGIPSKQNDKIFAFMSFLQSPQSKEQLSGPVKGLANFQIQELDMILRVTNSKRAYFYDLQKISTHIRQFLAITHLYETELAPFIYDPELVDKKQYEIIQENERHQLEPILDRLSSEFNKTQFQSIREMVVRDQGIVLLQGPPGTGKTTTLMGLLAAQYHYLKFVCSLEEKQKILICAPSNAAIDHITKRLVCQGLASTDNCKIFPNILRVGIVETQDPDIRSVSLDDICDKRVHAVKQHITKKNNMTTIQVKQKIVSLNKQIFQTQLKNRANPHFDNQLKIKRIKQEVRQYESLLYTFRKQKIQQKQMFMQEEKKLFDEADIILTTLSSSGSDKMQRVRGYIGCLIVDEAAQSTQPNLLISLQSFAKKVLLIGDPCQLPSTTLSQDSQITLFNRSLFERFIDAGVKPYFLNIQYRMAPPIREFASNTFYEGRLLDDESILERYKNLQYYKKQWKRQANNENEVKMQKSPLLRISRFLKRNYFMVDVKFGEEEFYMNSYRNLGEASVVSYLVYKFMKNTKLSIGVITPYQSQRKHLLKNLIRDIQHEKRRNKFDKKQKKEKVTEDNEKHEKNESNSFQSKKNKKVEGQTNQQKEEEKKKELTEMNKQNSSVKEEEDPMSRIMINTVDSFQGQEKDIIIVSTVRSNTKRDIGFMKDQRRINVALTRSRHLMIVVGHGNTLGSNQTWNRLLDWHEQHNTYYSIQSKEHLRDLYYNIENDRYDENVERKRYDKLSRDWRKLDRNEIKSSDFGLGIPRKRIKVDESAKPKKSIHERFGDKKEDEKQHEKVQENMEIEKKELNEMEIENQIKKQEIKNDQVEKMMNETEKWFEEKRERENQAMKLQQINKRLKDLESKMASENSGFAMLFK